jgi:hypothetical protein
VKRLDLGQRALQAHQRLALAHIHALQQVAHGHVAGADLAA